MPEKTAFISQTIDTEHLFAYNAFKGGAVSLRQWFQKRLRGSKRERPSEKTDPATRTLAFSAPVAPPHLQRNQSLPTLTPRELEIVRLLRKGYSNKEIAQELNIAVTTVKWNMTNILAKFEVGSSRQLLAFLATHPDDSRDWTILE